ncbi:MAG: DUF2085 domain-containing protein [Chloroflexi bacterium]|nr:DUF2085 domain-containing protein [Chloroflexota bacterium]
MTIEGALRRWLLLANAAAAVFIALPLLAPLLLAAGLDRPANLIYWAYSAVCHQWAFRSYFLFGPEWTYPQGTLAGLIGESGPYRFVGSADLGYKVAFCERDVAIYLSVLLTGLAYAVRRGPSPGNVAGLSMRAYALLILPMALDGFSQLFGWRESDVLLRTLTGGLFGAASVWLIYPRIDAILERDLGPARPAVGTLDTGVRPA